MKSEDILIKVSVIALAIALIVLAFQFNANDNDDTISVSGSSEISAISDIVKINLGVEVKANTANEVETSLSRISNDVINSLKEIVGSENIETSNYNIYKNEIWDFNRQVYIEDGYRGSYVIKVTSKDITKAGTIISTAIESGATNVNSLSFELSDAKQEQLKKTALNDAILVAKDKAEILAKASDSKLGKVISISENNFYYFPNVRSFDSITKTESLGIEILPQTVDINAQVSVVYKLK